MTELGKAQATPTNNVRPLRIRRPPVFDGPYDDELAEPPAYIDGSLALALPGLDRSRVPLRLVPPAQAPDDADGPLPPLGPVATTLSYAVMEVLAGLRSPSQLSALTTYDVLAQLERSTGRFGSISNGRPAVGAPRPRVMSVHISQPAARAAEVCVVVDLGRRRKAFALRLDGVGSKWRCTAVQLA